MPDFVSPPAARRDGELRTPYLRTAGAGRGFPQLRGTLDEAGNHGRGVIELTVEDGVVTLTGNVIGYVS